MTSKLSCNPPQRPPAISRRVLLLPISAAICALMTLFVCTPLAAAGDAPQWMHAQVGAPLPAYDEKTDAVLLYSETDVTVVSADKIKTTKREVYKILRPNGRWHGTVPVYFNPSLKIKSLHGWCIPAQGKDYEVKDKDAVDRAANDGVLEGDARVRVLTIPAADPGNFVGYEYEVEEKPFFLQDMWIFQERDPVRESHYSLQLPPGWEFKVSWLNHPEVQSTSAGNNFWQWTVNDVKEIRHEPAMPPFQGVAGQMIVTYFPPGGKATNGFAEWNDLGNWINLLMAGRVEASPEVKQQVAVVTAGKNTQLEKMRAIAQFVQHDIRYVAIELGIGGWQPHPAPEVFSHRYGDCKDKATLTRSMLHEIGIESFHVVINTQRGVVTRETPAHNFGFNHAIVAIKLPEGLKDPSLVATKQDAKLGRILFFDPTDDITPFGQIRDALQANYALLVTPDGGELLPLPQQPSAMNSIERTAKLTLDSAGTLKGDVKEVRLGGRAASERSALMGASKDADRIKPIETLLANSLSSFRVTHATVTNLQHTDQPFGFDYSFESDHYAKNAGGLLLVRPRVLGNKAFNFFDSKEPRKYAFEFDGPARDVDTFEIAIPAGYEVDDMPPNVDADYSFASYHSKTEVSAGVIRYTRTFEVKELSVPVDRADELKRFDRAITGDERSTVVLKAVAR
jgi:transglutaminase-like putative cysteine protease